MDGPKEISHWHEPKKITYLIKDSETVNDNKACLLFLQQNILLSYIIFSCSSLLLPFFKKSFFKIELNANSSRADYHINGWCLEGQDTLALFIYLVIFFVAPRKTLTLISPHFLLKTLGNQGLAEAMCVCGSLNLLFVCVCIWELFDQEQSRRQTNQPVASIDQYSFIRIM